MLRELTAGVQAILGNNLIGFYPQGSFAAGTLTVTATSISSR